MNNLFLELNKKYANYKNPTVNRNNKLPVVIVQGYAEPSWYFMYGIYRDLRKNDWQALYPVNLFPNITDIKEQAKIVARKIDEAKKEQKVNKVNYVAHSMGGLIGRYYIQEMRGANNIDHYVSISTPHYGTHVSWLGLGEAAKQMRPGSEFLTKLNANYPIYGSVKYTSIWTKTDEIVIPAENAVLVDEIKSRFRKVEYFSIVIFLLINLMRESGQLTYILLLTVYGIDSVMTILYRLWRGENIFQPHKVHLFQLLVHQLKWSQLSVSGLYALTQLLINGYVIWLTRWDAQTQFWGSFALLAVLTLAYVLIKNRLLKPRHKPDQGRETSQVFRRLT
ncbi:MAG: alpha/beta hydrolase [Chitinophagaceae bacterium]|nr:MAG: alpha/beta hydrolase [Chitinophagaceae bacterium]